MSGKTVPAAVGPDGLLTKITICLWAGGQGCGRTAGLPLFRIKNYRAELARKVSLPAQEAAMNAGHCWYTQINETRNETIWTCSLVLALYGQPPGYGRES
jgi:hypothetical protein